MGLPATTVRQIAKAVGPDELALRPACLEILTEFETESRDET